MGRLGVSIALLCVMFGFALAQQRGGKQQRADELFEEGRKLLAAAGDDKAKVGEACAKFDEAIKLDPEAPGTMLNLGLCNEKLEKYKTALYWFRKAQARASETGLPEYEQAAKAHTEALAKQVATIKITFSTMPPPAGTRVKIDGEEIPPADYLRAEVDPGKHTLVAGAPGRKIVTMEFDVVGRGGQTLNIELLEGDNAIIIDRGRPRKKAAVYIAIGGGVLMAASAGLSWWAKEKYDIYVNDDGAADDTATGDRCGPDNDCDNVEATNAANHYQTIARWVGTPIFIGGTLAVAGAAILYLTAPSRERIDQTVELMPTVSPDGIGFVASGRF